MTVTDTERQTEIRRILEDPKTYWLGEEAQCALATVFEVPSATIAADIKALLALMPRRAHARGVA